MQAALRWENSILVHEFKQCGNCQGGGKVDNLEVSSLSQICIMFDETANQILLHFVALAECISAALKFAV